MNRRRLTPSPERELCERMACPRMFKIDDGCTDEACPPGHPTWVGVKIYLLDPTGEPRFVATLKKR